MDRNGHEINFNRIFPSAFNSSDVCNKPLVIDNIPSKKVSGAIDNQKGPRKLDHAKIWSIWVGKKESEREAKRKMDWKGTLSVSLMYRVQCSIAWIQIELLGMDP
jgi:hypothetical protein